MVEESLAEKKTRKIVFLSTLSILSFAFHFLSGEIKEMFKFFFKQSGGRAFFPNTFQFGGTLSLFQHEID